jgi:hypothetical protein
MLLSIAQSPSSPESDSTKDFSSALPEPEKKMPLWLMILLATITAIVVIWVMLIVIYPSLALSLA